MEKGWTKRCGSQRGVPWWSKLAESPGCSVHVMGVPDSDDVSVKLGLVGGFRVLWGAIIFRNMFFLVWVWTIIIHEAY